MFIGTRVFSDTLAQQALDRELFEAVSSERGRLWGTVASVLARGANPNAIMHLAAPLAPLGNPLTYLTFTERKRGWMAKIFSKLAARLLGIGEEPLQLERC